jgi:F-type H+-transporting ATPase subunit delta
MATPRAAIRYAKSLFSLAEEKGLVDSIEKDIRLLSQAVQDSDDLEMLLKSPVIKADAKESILTKIFEEKVERLTMEFIKILVRKGRESILPAIVDESLNLIRLVRNIRVAEVRTAIPMDEALRGRVSAALKHLHDGEVELQEMVVPELLGGFQLHMDNRMIDASIKRELELLRRQIKEHDYEPEF